MRPEFFQTLRSLRRRPVFSAAVILTLGLTTGASTAVFSVLSHVIWRPLPLANPDQLTMLWERNLATTGGRSRVAPGNYHDWRNRAKSFQGLAAFTRWEPLLRGTDTSETLKGARVTADFFEVLQVSPALGQGLFPSDGSVGETVLISHGFWQRRFGGDAGIFGQTMALRELNGEEKPYIIVGVMPAEFQFPWPLFTSRPDVWSPLRFENLEQERRGRSLNVVGRLRHGVRVEDARLEMTVLARQLELEHPPTNRNWGVEALPLQEEIVGNVRPSLLLLMAAVLCLQLLACANMASLLLARVFARMKEFAIRCALGAGRVQLVKHVLLEGLVLAFLGGGLGVLLAAWATNLIRALGPSILPRGDEVGIDGIVVAFAACSSFVTGLAVAAAPAWHASSLSPIAILKEVHPAGLRRGFSWQARKLLAVGQVALAVTLLVACGLLLKSFVRLHRVAAGVDMQGVLTIEVGLPGALYPEFRHRRQFFERLVERAEKIPGVTFAAAVSSLPYQRAWQLGFSAGDDKGAEGFEGKAEVRVVHGDCFRALRIPLIRGRLLSVYDAASASPRVAIINRSLARQVWGVEDPLGKQVRIQYEGRRPYTVVGVVEDVRKFGGRAEAEPEIYIPYSEGHPAGMTLLVRAGDGHGSGLVNEVRQAVASAGGGAILRRVASLENLWFESFSHPRLQFFLLAGFAGLAILLATIGVYGIVSFAVVQQTREIGVRLALGATPRQVLSLLMVHVLELGAIGILLGLGGAVIFARLLRGMLYEVITLDPAVYLFAAFLMLVTSFVACVVPAVRALRIDPAAVLRFE